ncbi:TraR/DksA family transcriptional regulator [Actinocorallia sp. A-T 12471]|uniref:TraR/DksA family transcriptional regulator n=1 Tax=Actinocorallia sp. A-T 12471 TaxID=3089813 RepID=UPI0029D38CDE|nr:TraR/DksA C4-type zinc finger protein [Actinocorallia sp. A-T 12471]MDX6740099.1 TraR/DksA C4-type zinc finger protein [Actinocorallia sp. A-T 12471]
MTDTAPSPDERARAATLIDGARAANERLITSLTDLWDELVASSDGSNADDEHDPEGATIAFERERLTESLARARADLAALDQAAARLADGSYWTCATCGGPIAPARLEARPTARTCIACARRR